VNWIEQIVTALLKWLVGAVKQDQTCEDAKPQEKLRNELLDRIAEHESWLRVSCDLRQERDSDQVGSAGEGKSVGD